MIYSSFPFVPNWVRPEFCIFDYTSWWRLLAPSNGQKARWRERERDLARSCISLNFSRLVCVYRSGRPPQKLRSESNHFRVPANAVCVISLCVCVSGTERERKKETSRRVCWYTYILKRSSRICFLPNKTVKNHFLTCCFFYIPFIFLGALVLPPISSPVQWKYYRTNGVAWALAVFDRQHEEIRW